MRLQYTPLILLVLVLFLSPDVGLARRDVARDTVDIGGHPRGFRGETVAVIDHFGRADYSAEAAVQIARLNALLPPNAPQFVLRVEPAPCVGATWTLESVAKDTLELCPAPPSGETGGGRGPSVGTRDRITHARVWVATNTGMWDFAKVLCHELMHVTAGLAHEDMPVNDGSCFRGPLAQMGPTDAAVFESIYADHEKDKDKRNGKGKHRRHGKR